MFYDTLKEYPLSGSPAESLAIYVRTRRDHTEHARWKAVIQGVQDEEGESTQKAWDAYVTMAFPHYRGVSETKDLALKAKLQQYVHKTNQGIKVTPMAPVPSVAKLQKRARTAHSIRNKIAGRKRPMG